MTAMITVIHDLTRVKKGGLYPVKLRVYHSYKKHLYSTGISLTEKGFQDSYLAVNPRGENLKNKNKINAILAKAVGICEKLDSFTFEAFEKRMFKPTGYDTSVSYSYQAKIDQLKERGKINTAVSYECSMNSIEAYTKKQKINFKTLSFDRINKNFLEGYEHWMIAEKRSKATIGIYLRPLRALFNEAIQDGAISVDAYPFGVHKYQIPKGQNIKKALTRPDLKLLFQYETKDELVIKARSFFFFSYSCNGMNFRDIAELKFKNITNDGIRFVRSKTKDTVRGAAPVIYAPLSALAVKVIERYGNIDQSQDNYVFPIIDDTMNPEVKLRKIQLFIRFVNEHMKKLAKLVGVDPDISTYYARHSFASLAIQDGAPLVFVQEGLGHKNIQTTMQYNDTLPIQIKNKFSNQLMEF